MQEIFDTILNENISNCCGGNIQEIFEYLAHLGFSKKEAIDFVDRNYLDDINWMDDDEDEQNETVSNDFSRFTAMLDRVGANYLRYDKYRIALKRDDYECVEFDFDKDFNLKEILW